MAVADVGQCPIFPIPDKAPDITLLGWVVVTEPDGAEAPYDAWPPSAGVAAKPVEAWGDDEHVDDQLLSALRHADGRRVVIDIRFVDD
jgi:hypothetical protein